MKLFLVSSFVWGWNEWGKCRLRQTIFFKNFSLSSVKDFRRRLPSIFRHFFWLTSASKYRIRPNGTRWRNFLDWEASLARSGWILTNFVLEFLANEEISIATGRKIATFSEFFRFRWDETLRYRHQPMCAALKLNKKQTTCHTHTESELFSSISRAFGFCFFAAQINWNRFSGKPLVWFICGERWNVQKAKGIIDLRERWVKLKAD